MRKAASIVAIIPTPSRLSPFRNPEQNINRRNNYVLRSMAEEGYITKEEAAEAAKRPLVLQGQPAAAQSIAPYFVEEIRKVLEQKYGADALYQTGLRVQTTLDAKLQEAANLALDRGLRRIDKRRTGYRKAAQNVLADGKDIESFKHERWSQAILAGDIVPAVVTYVPEPKEKGNARVRIASHEVELPPSAFQWTRRTSPSTLFKVERVEGT